MSGLAASLLGALTRAQNVATAVVLAVFVALFLRALLLLLLDTGRSMAVVVLRALSGAAVLALALLYALFTANLLVWDAMALGLAVLSALAVLSGPVYRRLAKRPAPPPGPTALLVQLCLILTLLLLATLTLMRAGYLALTEDRTILLVDVTGETGSRVVRWGPPDRPLREESLTTHRVVFRKPDGTLVSEAWVYGDQVAVKGRVLRLSPALNAAGVPNLFELLFAHNGYLTAERHNEYPHEAFRLPPQGPLAVHPWWRPLQSRLLEAWERGSSEGSGWAVRSVSTESTYYPLADAEGRPIKQAFRLVLTPGGLSSS